MRRLWMTSVDTFKPLRTRSAGPFAGNLSRQENWGGGGGGLQKRNATTETQRDLLAEKMPGSYLENHLTSPRRCRRGAQTGARDGGQGAPVEGPAARSDAGQPQLLNLSLSQSGLVVS